MAQNQDQDSKYYSFKVGNVRPDAVEYGRVNKDGQPIGPTSKGFAQVGVHGMPNSSDVWGKPKLDKNGKRTGEIEFMSWGTSGGVVNSIRYLKSTSSIDRLYQEENGIKAGPEDIELVFQTGVNKVSRRDQPALVAMLENHSLNHDSISRSPDIETFVFSNYNATAELEEKTKARETKVIAQQHVIDAGKVDRGIDVLARVFNKDMQIEAAELQDQLWDEAETNPEGFLEYINKYKDVVEAKLIEAEEYGIVKFEETGKIIFVLEGKPKPLGVDPSFNRERKMAYLKDAAITVEVNDLLSVVENEVRAAKENITK